MTAYYLLIVLAVFVASGLLRGMGRSSTSPRRGVIIWLSIIGGAAVGVLGGFAACHIVNPHPEGFGQESTGEAILVLFVIAPVCAIVAGKVAETVTKDLE